MALSLQAGAAVAGTAYDRCIAEEKALRTEAADRCSGLSYILNPSGCFIAQKALKAFDCDKCRAIRTSEKTGTEPQSITVAVPPRSDSGHEKAPHEAPEPEPDVEQLKAENARLKAEIVRLRAEMRCTNGVVSQP
jgi:molecular chaperone GrpE (heat shock protein)